MIICVNVILMVAAARAKIVRLLSRLLLRLGWGYLICLVMHVIEIWWLGLRLYGKERKHHPRDKLVMF